MMVLEICKHDIFAHFEIKCYLVIGLLLVLIQDLKWFQIQTRGFICNKCVNRGETKGQIKSNEGKDGKKEERKSVCHMNPQHCNGKCGLAHADEG